MGYFLYINLNADVYLAGTVMLIFAMGLYGLFISNSPNNVAATDDRALKGSTLFGMFALRVRLCSNELVLHNIYIYWSYQIQTMQFLQTIQTIILGNNRPIYRQLSWCIN